MPTKTDRILSYLPYTFNALPPPSALYSVVDAFGNELQGAENSLAAIMMAHWVDYADQGAELIQDLACIAALYGLAPRNAVPLYTVPAGQGCPPLISDETVEGFRTRLKRHVRTFLNGTVTVQGILRVVAEALALDIDDDYAKLDTWWTRPDDSLVTVVPRGEDIAPVLFGSAPIVVQGEPSRPAQVTGTPDLAGGITLRPTAILRLRIDGGPPIDVAPTAGADLASLDQVVATINDRAGRPLATPAAGRLVLAAPSAGPGSTLQIEDVLDDAAPDLLGLLPRAYHGIPATPARITGEIDLSAGADLSSENRLRLQLDGGPMVEVDCASLAADRTRVTLDEIIGAINDQMGETLASHDGSRLLLTSLSPGGASTVLLGTGPADATPRLFGAAPRFATGTPPQPAGVTGGPDLSGGIDLSGPSQVRIRIDTQAPVTIECAGARPADTSLAEIVDAINRAFGRGLASGDGRHVRVESPTLGPASSIVFESLPDPQDATELIFGISSRTFTGTPATRATVTGVPDLSAGVNLMAQHTIRVAIDGSTPVDVPLRPTANQPAAATLDEITAAVNARLRAGVATHDGSRLTLASPTMGGAGSVAVQPLTTTITRRFVTRAFITDEASQYLLGFIRASATGNPATPARITGSVDLSRGIDLSHNHFLRVSVDGAPPHDVDCASRLRPRLTMPPEIVAALNAALGSAGSASFDGHVLTLASHAAGAHSRIAVESRLDDAFETIFGNVARTATGTVPSPAVITGTLDLRGPVDLSERHILRLAINGGAPVDLDAAGSAPESTTLDEVVARLNAQQPGLASIDGDHLRLTAPASAGTSSLELIPLRALELIEYPPEPVKEKPIATRHGDRLVVDNDGAADAGLRIDIAAPGGEVGPSLVNLTAGTRLLTTAVLDPGDTLSLARDPVTGVAGQITARDGSRRSVPATAIVAGPIGMQVPVPFDGEQALHADSGRPGALQLNDPLAPAILLLRDREAGKDTPQITVQVRKAGVSGASPLPATDGRTVTLSGTVRRDASGYVLAGPSTPVRLLPGSGIEVEPYLDQVVMVSGQLHGEPGGQPSLLAGSIAALFDVTIRATPARGAAVREEYPGVTVGRGWEAEKSLWREIAAKPSTLVTAWEMNKGDVLAVPRGQSEWIYLDCDGARFDYADFDSAVFAGGPCVQRAIFDISRFVPGAPDPAAVFAPDPPLPDPAVDVSFRWSRFQPGAFVVNLPADLPASFGARFGEGRFARDSSAPERYEPVVSEPPGDPDFIGTRINGHSTLITASVVPRVPIGWSAESIPFPPPRYRSLSGGRDGQPAQIYLHEPGAATIIRLAAREPGAWGNDITLSVRPAGPAQFEVTVSYEGAVFENARQVALGAPLKALAQDTLRPGPVGVNQAKAAGIQAFVTRDQTFRNPEDPPLISTDLPPGTPSS